MGPVKQQLGQFMTTNYEHILVNMNIPDDVNHIVEPFCGNGDLLKIVNEGVDIERYDIDPKSDSVVKRDTLMDPPSYEGKYVITNPPYLARNKSSDKCIFDKYDCNDLYKCFIMSIISDTPYGGIVIIPLNFLCSIRKADIGLRRRFVESFFINRINVFEEQVFDDTSYTVCTLQFTKRVGQLDYTIPVDFYPSHSHIDVRLTVDSGYMIGGEIYSLQTSGIYSITRLTSANIDKQHSNILAKCIDDNSSNMIRLSMVDDEDIYVDNTPRLSARTYATLVITPFIDLQQQRKLVDAFNAFLNEKRARYNSMFLTNYRESKDIARKRISFGLVYSICKHLLQSHTY